MRTGGLTPRALIGVVAGAASLGLVLTIGSLTVGTDVHGDPHSDGYRGDARLLGYPQPFTYVLTSDTSAGMMDLQVSCVIAGPFCRYPAMSSRLGLLPLAADWLVWSLVAAPGALAAVVVWRLGRRSLEPSKG